MSIRLGDIAPDFTADTTQGVLSFHDWKEGAWAVLFSHPADFTPVCTTELGRTAALSGEFAARNAKAIAVSVDSVKDHLRWVPDIAEVAGVDVDFPIIADEDRSVSQAYDMIHPGEGDTSTARSASLIDPSHTVRLTITYPKSVGRNFTEILRALDALQATDRSPISTPAEWVPGDRVIVAPAIATDDARERFANVDEVKPYLRFADAPA
mgnify:FL=1